METLLIFSTLRLFVPTIFLSTHCHYTSYLTCHIVPHIYAPSSINFSSLSEDKNRQHSLQAGDRVGTVVKVLCYKSEGRWFDPSWCHWNFSVT